MTKKTEEAMSALVAGKAKVETCASNRALLEIQNAFRGVPLGFTITQGDLGRATLGTQSMAGDPTNTSVVLLAVPTDMEADGY